MVELSDGLQVIGALLGPYKLAASFALVLGLVAGTFALGYSKGSTAKQGEWDATVVAEQRGKDAALKAAAEAIAKIEVKSEHIIQPLRTEIRTNTVYRDCRHSDDSLRNLNSLITGSEPQSTGGGIVPNTYSDY